MAKRMALVVGASSGIGAELALGLVKAGFDVIGTSRKAAASLDEVTGGYRMTQVDVCDDDSVQALRDRLEANHCLPDTVIVNAGFGIAGAIEDTPVALAQRQFETNLFGAHRVARAFLPHLRTLKPGRIIFVGSLASEISVPFQGFYSASKAAIASYAEALNMEVAALGVHASVIDIGDHKTDFGSSRLYPENSEASVYEPQASRAVGIMEASEAEAPPAKGAADRIIKIANADNPDYRIIKGRVVEWILVIVKRYISRTLARKMVMLVFKVPRKVV